jgi:hypothetical protein
VSDAERRERARARSGRVILHKAQLQPDELDLSPVDGAEGVSLLTRLSIQSHRMAGLSEPTYTRRNIPVRFVPGRLT